MTSIECFGESGGSPPLSLNSWLTANEAAQYLKVKTRTLLLWTRQGRIKGHQLSGTKRHVWRYRAADLDAALLGTGVLHSVLPSVLVPKGEK